jgi:hypothetical protein
MKRGVRYRSTNRARRLKYSKSHRASAQQCRNTSDGIPPVLVKNRLAAAILSMARHYCQAQSREESAKSREILKYMPSRLP